jgi:hypothetical protein
MKDQPRKTDELADTQVLDKGPSANAENDDSVVNDDDTKEMPALSIEKLESMLKSKE